MLQCISTALSLFRKGISIPPYFRQFFRNLQEVLANLYLFSLFFGNVNIGHYSLDIIFSLDKLRIVQIIDVDFRGILLYVHILYTVCFIYFILH